MFYLDFNRIHFNRVDYGFTESILPLPSPKTTVTISMMGFTTDVLVQDIIAEVNFYLCPRLLMNLSFANASMFEAKMHLEKCGLIDTQVSAKQVINNQADFGSIEKELKEIVLDKVYFPICWEIASMVAVVWDVALKGKVNFFH